MKQLILSLSLCALFLLPLALGAQNALQPENTSVEAQAGDLGSGQETAPSISRRMHKKMGNFMKKAGKLMGEQLFTPKGKPNSPKDKGLWRDEFRALAVVALVLAGLVILGALLFMGAEVMGVAAATTYVGISLLLAFLGAIFTAIIAIKALLSY